MVNVVTNRYNSARTGANLEEPCLDQTNVNVNDFGKLFSRGVDGQIYAQPLIVSDLKLPRGGSREVVYVATTRNMVYAFDAKTPEACHPIWRVNLDGSNASPVPRSDYGPEYTDFTDEIGIVSTPVIDLRSSTIYLTAKTRQYKRNKPHYLYKLHALDIKNGAKKYGSPAIIAETIVNDPLDFDSASNFRFVSGPAVKGSGAGNIDGTIHFNTFFQLQRTGLLLHDNVLYLGFGSHGDKGDYHGWIMAFDAKSLKFIAAHCTTPDWGEGGVWQSGCGLAADETGAVYAVCGNGSAHYQGANDPGQNRLSAGPYFGQSVLKLKLNRKAKKLEINDWFTAKDILANNLADDDLCSGPVLLPWKNLVGAWGKDRAYYVMNREQMGRFNPGSNAIEQYAPRMTEPQNPTFTSHIHCAPVVFSDPVVGPVSYVWAENDRLRGYPFDVASSKFATTPPANLLSTHYLPHGMPGGMLTISCNGTASQKAEGRAIVWALHPVTGDANHGTVAGMLQAFKADDLRQAIYSSNHDPLGTDDLGDFAKFCPPVVANGKVYVATFSQQLVVYGLLPARQKDRPVVGKWLQADIPIQTKDDDRTFRVEGTASYSCHRFTILGAGVDIWGNADAFHYVYKTAKDGPITLTARVLRVTRTNDWAKAGVMIRESLDAGSAHAMMAVSPGNGANFFNRKAKDGETEGESFGNVGGAPYWVRIERKPLDDGLFQFTGFASADGKSWEKVGNPATVAMGPACLVGMAVTSHAKSTPPPGVDPDDDSPLQDLCTATFDSVVLR
jgi:outer membrane protein assembly factor BamB